MLWGAVQVNRGLGYPLVHTQRGSPESGRALAHLAWGSVNNTIPDCKGMCEGDLQVFIWTISVTLLVCKCVCECL